MQLCRLSCPFLHISRIVCAGKGYESMKLEQVTTMARVLGKGKGHVYMSVYQLDLASPLCTTFLLFILNSFSAPARCHKHPMLWCLWCSLYFHSSLLCNYVSKLVAKGWRRFGFLKRIPLSPLLRDVLYMCLHGSAEVFIGNNTHDKLQRTLPSSSSSVYKLRSN